MIIVLKNGAPQDKSDQLRLRLKDMGFDIHESRGKNTTILGLIGDTSVVDIEQLQGLDIVEAVRRVSEPYKLVNRKYHVDDTVIHVAGIPVGGEHFTVFAGPCSVESVEQITGVAKQVQKAGASILRGGAFKPRTSPYAFKGLRAHGIELLLEAKKETGMPICTELTSLNQLDLFRDVDIIQVGARNMQNFEMLTELGSCGKPVLLKRGLSSTIEEWLMSAEYIVSSGNDQVILCERGIRTFETATRNTLDISAVPLLKQLTHLPVIVDPSHASGLSSLIQPLSKTAVVAGADGLMVEVHPDPENALCDGAQSITPAVFDQIMRDIRGLCDMEHKKIPQSMVIPK